MEAHVGHAVFVAPEQADVEVHVQIERKAAAKLEAQVEMRGAHGAIGGRTIESPSARCAAFAGTLVLVVAMLVDVPRDEVAAEPQGEPAKPPVQPVVPPLEPAPPAPPHVEPRRSAPWLAQAAVFAEGIAGVLPGFDAGVGVSGSLRAPWGPALILGLDGFPSATATRATGEVDFSALVLGVAVSPFLFRFGSQLRFEPWVGATADFVFAKATGFDENISGTRSFFGLSGGTDAALRLGKGLFVVARAGLLVPLSRPGFVYQGPEGLLEVHRVSPLGATLGLGIGWGNGP